MAESYPIADLCWPWYGGVGAFAGVPCVRLALGPSRRRMTGHDLIDSVRGMLPLAAANRPRWFYVTDAPLARFDNELLLLIRTLLAMRTAIETDGREPMAADQPRLPIYDHVVVRAPMPLAVIRTQLFHSVVLDGTPTAAAIRATDETLAAHGYRGPRYIVAADPAPLSSVAAVTAAGGDWRMTQPLRAVAPRARRA